MIILIVIYYYNIKNNDDYNCCYKDKGQDHCNDDDYCY